MTGRSIMRANCAIVSWGRFECTSLPRRERTRDYLQNGRTYLFACSLRRLNAAARQLLLTCGHLLPEEQVPDALALVRHYDVWLTFWDEHSARLKPAMADPFVFENAVNFPKSAQERLMDLYQRLP